tara:strand:- start:332 stop:679 length:348 start_codon:yes stop_codon:yes gene_type:complete
MNHPALVIQFFNWTRLRLNSNHAGMISIWHWEARDAERNIARSYRLEISTDLFGWTIVEQRWGRIGSRGQTKCLAFAAMDDAANHVERVRRRRSNAQRRIGVAYHEVPTSIPRLR